MTDSTWQYTQGEVVLSVPQITERIVVTGIIVNDDPLPENMVHIPLSKVDYVITNAEYRKKYAEFSIGERSFYVIDSPEVRQALENTMFENVFKAGDDDDRD